MKYVITESQFKSLNKKFPIGVIRRATKEFLTPFINEGQLAYPLLCTDFSEDYEYADAVIDYAIDDFLGTHFEDIEDEDYYSDVMDYLRNICRNLFESELIEIYNMTCIEYSKN